MHDHPTCSCCRGHLGRGIPEGGIPSPETGNSVEKGREGARGQRRAQPGAAAAQFCRRAAARGRIPVRDEGRGAAGRASRGPAAATALPGRGSVPAGLGEAAPALAAEKALLMESKTFAFEKPGVGERAWGLPWKPRAEPCRGRSRSHGGSEGSGTARGSPAPPGASRETDRASRQRWETGSAAGKGSVCAAGSGREAEPGRAQQSRGHQPGVNKSCGVTAAGAAPPIGSRSYLREDR